MAAGIAAGVSAPGDFRRRRPRRRSRARAAAMATTAPRIPYKRYGGEVAELVVTCANCTWTERFVGETLKLPAEGEAVNPAADVVTRYG